ENGNYIPTKEDGIEIPRSSWNEDWKISYLLNSKARNFLICSLTETEYEKIHSCKSSKEMWDTLTLVYEGMSYIKGSKIKDHESIDQMLGRFQNFQKFCENIAFFIIFPIQEHFNKMELWKRKIDLFKRWE
ncbi:hypothetical protein CR513_21842, partial [Mucuna pruriens]